MGQSNHWLQMIASLTWMTPVIFYIWAQLDIAKMNMQPLHKCLDFIALHIIHATKVMHVFFLNQCLWNCIWFCRVVPTVIKIYFTSAQTILINASHNNTPFYDHSYHDDPTPLPTSRPQLMSAITSPLAPLCLPFFFTLFIATTPDFFSFRADTPFSFCLCEDAGDCPVSVLQLPSFTESSLFNRTAVSGGKTTSVFASASFFLLFFDLSPFIAGLSCFVFFFVFSFFFESSSSE